MTERLTGPALRDMILCAAAALEQNKQAINELNVFPVPDGDTSTNMSLTMRAGADELLHKSLSTVEGVADCAASALLRGARGNSGVILSLLFRGMSKNQKGASEEVSAIRFAKALSDGVDAAYKAVMKPAEGTILTVSRKATEAALEFARAGTDIELMLVCALEAAKEALAETVHQNPVLTKAGVIDAGGKGYVVILDAMLSSLQGKASYSYAEVGTDDEADDRNPFAAFDTEEITFAYDTVFIVRRTTDRPLDLLRAYLDSIGDSLVIGEDDDVFKVHVHTNIPGDAITEAQKYGTLETAKIENMRTQHDELVGGASAADAPRDDASGAVSAAPEKRYGSVVVCAGAGMETLFRELGADGIVTGGQTMNPSTDDILKEINKTPADTVFVFPNNKNIIMAAEQCAPLTEKKVIVIPTTTVPQGVSALLSMDEFTDEEELAELFSQSIASVHTALVTYAARDSVFDGLSISAGEYLALMDGALIGSFPAFDDVLSHLSDAIDALSPELLSVYYGEDVTEDDAQGVVRALEARFPDAEVSLVSGGQPVYYYMIAAE